MSNTTQNKTAEIDGVCEMLDNMSTADNEDIISICANCGKEGSDVTNICNKCKSVKYCNAACKKKHRKKHKKECERRVAELHDEQLFKQPLSKEDCPICMIPLPPLPMATTYMACCGKVICRGCIYAVQKTRNRKRKATLCPFCRIPAPTSKVEIMERYKKRIDIGDDSTALRNLGCRYRDGEFGLPQSHDKALELWHQAAELGDSTAHFNIGNAYIYGRGVAEDIKKAIHYFELAAMGGNAGARHALGVFEGLDGNHYRAIKHWVIAAGGGDHDSLKAMQGMYTDGHATKDDFETALRSYQAYLDEIRSVQRDEAAAAQGDYTYYHSAF